MSRVLSRRHALGLAGTALAGTALAGCGAPEPSAVATTDGTDLVVYGATAAGLVAAIQAARMGRTVVVVEPGTHVGGLTTGGLGWTDSGAPDSIGGIASEFYRRIARRYGQTDDRPRLTFAPSVAAAVLDEMLVEADVPVRTGARLRTVLRSGDRITALVTEAGVVHRGRMFIDASYEGDLMAAAGVGWTVGREANAEHGETLNGVHLRPKVPLETTVDPYRVPGHRRSGVLPGVVDTPLPPNGTADGLIQAYNYRMCLTQAPTRIRFPRPEGYDPDDYELLRRYIDKGVTGPFFSFYPVGQGKTDSNNHGPFSTDFIGHNYAYPTASWAQRESIADAHRAYQQGLVYFLANDRRLPVAIRESTASWGLPVDEFTTNGGWPTQLYVREARRMRAGYVMTEHDCRGDRAAFDSVGLASYTMDSHNTQRVVVDGEVRNEGDVLEAIPGRTRSATGRSSRARGSARTCSSRCASPPPTSPTARCGWSRSS